MHKLKIAFSQSEYPHGYFDLFTFCFCFSFYCKKWWFYTKPFPHKLPFCVALSKFLLGHNEPGMNQHPPEHHAGWMICGHQITFSLCIPIP